MLKMFKSIVDGIKAESELKSLLMEENYNKEEMLREKQIEAYQKLNKYRDYTNDLIDRIKRNENIDINKETEKMNRLKMKLSEYERNIFSCFNKEFYTCMQSSGTTINQLIERDKKIIIELIKLVNLAIYKLHEYKNPTRKVDLFNDDDYNL
jgi:hypothetical protein